jgi:protease-4
MLEEIHAQFIGVVREGRGKRLKETPEMFSGLVWSGEKSIQLGLADGLGNVESVARDVIKAEDIVDYTRQDSLVERIAGRLGATMAKTWSPFDKAGVSLR